MPLKKIYTIDEDGDWKGLVDEDEEQQFIFRVEYAKSGRASCHLCKNRIQFKEIRIGTPVKFRGGGRWGFITSWKHISCERVPSEWRKVKKLAKHIYGMDMLKAKERKKVLKEITSTKKSEMLTPIAADDPNFWKSTEPRKKREAPPTFNGKLLPFQEEGLNWMLEREESKHGGGILADEMGMGKTIQTICLLLATLDKKPKLPTLIVCPSSALLQWASEIGHFTVENTLKVMVFYGNKAKSLTVPELMRFDVIMTSYNVVEWEYRKCLNKYKKKCPYCSKLYLPRALISHTRYFCGPNARRSAKLKLRDKKKATKKAMRTLRIIKDDDDDVITPIQKPKKKFRPTPMGVYLELMAEAGRDSIGWCSSLKKVDENQVLKDDDMVAAAGGGVVKRSTGKTDDSGSLADNNKTLNTPQVINKKAIIPSDTVPITPGLNGKATKCDIKPLPPEKENIANDDPSTPKKETIEKIRSYASPDESEDDIIILSGAPCTEKTPCKMRKMVDSDIEILSGPPCTRESPCKRRNVLKEKASKSRKKRKIRSRRRSAKKMKPASNHEDLKFPVSAKTMLGFPASAELTSAKPPSTKSIEDPASGTKERGPKAAECPAVTPDGIELFSCPSGHPVEQFVTWTDLFECDLCEEPQGTGWPMFGCRPCDYDVCTKCWKSLGGKVGDEPEVLLDAKKTIISEQRKRRWVCKCGALTEGNYHTCYRCEAPAPKRRKFEWVCKACIIRNPPGVASAKCTGCGRSKSKARSKLITPKSDSKANVTLNGSNGKVRARPLKTKEKKTCSSWEEDEKPDEINLSDSRLHMVPWGRIILDEAHKIKGRTTSTAMAVYALNAKQAKKWCLSGTPFQNRIGELYSLVKFLKLDPQAFYFCKMKGCNCKSTSWSFGPMSRKCDHCKHPPLKHYSYFNKHIINPVKRSGYVGEGKRAIYTLKSVLDEVQLRRTKKERAEDVKLPPLIVRIHDITLNEKEKDFYESIYKRCKTKFDAYVDKGTFLHNYAHIFDLLSRLRQTTDHPFLVVFSRPSEKALKWATEKSKTGESKEKVLAVEELPSKSRGGADVCYICQDQVKLPNIIVTGCKHVFHRTCMMTYLSNSPISELSNTKKKKKKKTKKKKGDQAGPSGEPDDLFEGEEGDDDGVLRDKTGCPVCFLPITVDLKTPINPREYARLLLRAKKDQKKGKVLSFGRGSILNKINLKNFESSTKVEELTRLVSEACNAKAHNKCIIFSQYTNMLDIIDWRLHKAGIKPVKLVGSMPINMRKSVLLAFKLDPNVRVILLSLRAGGEGLNLQSATHVFLMEPWWNPAVEYQAIQRAHRIGQTHEVVATRFITHGTIEQRMLELQEKKRLIFDGCIDQNAGSFSRLDAEDLKFLFRP